MANQGKLFTITSGYVYMAAIVTLLSVILFEYVFETRLASVLIIKRTVKFPKQNVQIMENLTILFDHVNSFIAGNGMTPMLAELLMDKSRALAYEKIRLPRNTTKRIVVHSPTHGMLRRDPTEVNMSKCIYNNCHVTVSKNTRGADAVILQGSKPTRPLPVRENPNQVFIFASLETPLYLNFVDLYGPFWNSFYNWSMTYRTDADIPYRYGYIVPKPISRATLLEESQMLDNTQYSRAYLEYQEAVFKNPVGLDNKNYSEIFRRKSVTAAWLVSHCGTASKREQYVKIMNESIDIDIFGKCSKRPCGKAFDVCDKHIVTQSKFYLALENSMCMDYITEKTFKWFERDIVIVVRGARNYGNHLPKGTYVEAEQFSSPRELALYLKRLGSNENEYIKYLKRKDMYKVFQHDFSAQIAYCNVCRKLNNLEIYKKRLDLTKSWVDDACIQRKNVQIQIN